MHPDLANLLGALRDDPDDEVAYLALADWCLEQPDEATQARCEHVRLSLEFGKLPRPQHGPGYQRKREAWKALAQKIIPELESKSEPKLDHDSSTNNLIRRYRRMKRD